MERSSSTTRIFAGSMCSSTLACWGVKLTSNLLWRRAVCCAAAPGMLAWRLTFQGGTSMSDAVHLTEKNFDETLAQHDGLLMVDFWAEWCGPCRAIAPVLEELARDSAGRITLAKVNVDENHALAARYAVRSIPTVLFVRQGKVLDQLIGAVPTAKIKEKLDALA